MVSEVLDQVQAEFPGVQTVAYADLDTGMVLVANSGNRLERHALNALCATASELLRAAPEGAPQPAAAVACARQSTHVFVRSDTQPEDALLCLLSGDVDLDALVKSARATLARIGDGG